MAFLESQGLEVNAKKSKGLDTQDFYIYLTDGSYFNYSKRMQAIQYNCAMPTRFLLGEYLDFTPHSKEKAEFENCYTLHTAEELEAVVGVLKGA